MERKQVYEKPSIETVTFAGEDVIRTSPAASFTVGEEGSGDAYSAADMF